jgi:hypothetical protein
MLVLPLAQLLLAVCLWLYIPFQFNRQMISVMGLKPEQVVGRSLGLSSETIELHFPPPAGRLLYAMNFPAYILSNWVQDLIEWRTTPALQFSWQDSTTRLPMTLYNFGLRELTFFLGVCGLWFWVGASIDRFAPRYDTHHRWKRLAEMAAVLIVGVILLWKCAVGLRSGNPPMHTIAAFGLIWPLVFFMKFFLSLRQELGGNRQSVAAP